MSQTTRKTLRKLANEELGRLSPEEFAQAGKNPCVLVLDNVRSMNNVGSAFRTADAFAVSKIYLCGITATPPHREITKTALGADLTVHWEHTTDTLTLVQQLQNEGFVVISIEQAEGSTMLQEFSPNPQQQYAFVFGNEVEGVSQEVVEASDLCIEIPQLGTKHSINVSVSLGIILWDYVSKAVELPSK